MISRYKRYPGGRVLGFGSTVHIQKRYYEYPGQAPSEQAAIIAILLAAVTLPPVGLYYSWKYLRNNFEIVRKDKTKAQEVNPDETKVLDEHRVSKRV